VVFFTAAATAAATDADAALPVLCDAFPADFAAATALTVERDAHVDAAEMAAAVAAAFRLI
jgi:hypothetical protein